MLQIISDPNRLQPYQQQFIDELDRAQTSTIHCLISWRPEYMDADVRWSSRLNLWWYSQPLENRWWNVFGIGQPISNEAVGITCEINIPMRGINRNIAGAFAENEDKRVFVVHRGNKWGGGREGITKELFWHNYSGRSEIVNDGGRQTRVAIIAELGNPNLPPDIAAFVNWVYRTKGLVP
ncbi:hypothetical protein M1N59_01065 [Dehalococcoidales bacterium]|nr:hypothetical protein [Dehalococcoidales bacterium]